MWFVSILIGSCYVAQANLRPAILYTNTYTRVGKTKAKTRVMQSQAKECHVFKSHKTTCRRSSGRHGRGKGLGCAGQHVVGEGDQADRRQSGPPFTNTASGKTVLQLWVLKSLNTEIPKE